MRDRGFGQPDDLGQVRDAQLAMRERIDEPDAGGIAEHGERRGQLFGGALVEQRSLRGRLKDRALGGSRVDCDHMSRRSYVTPICRSAPWSADVDRSAATGSWSPA